MVIRPLFTLIPTQNQIWPLDSWSRKCVVDLCDNNGIQFAMVPTSMHECAIQFYSTIDYLKFNTIFSEKYDGESRKSS